MPKRDEKGNLEKRNHQFGYESLKSYKKDLKVLYYVGPQKGINGKWRQRWTGPWTILTKLGNYRVRIGDINNNSIDVSIERLKKSKYNDLKNYINMNEYEKELERVQQNNINLDEDQGNP